MAKKKARTAKKNARRASSPRNLERSAHLDQVRELLFGEQMVALEKRLLGFEKEVRKKLAAVNREASRTAKASEKSARAALLELAKTVDRHHQELLESDAKSKKRIDGVKKLLARRISKLEEETTRKLATLRGRLSTATTKIRAELGTSHDDLLNEFSGELEEVQATVARRDTLSKLFQEISKRVGETS